MWCVFHSWPDKHEENPCAEQEGISDVASGQGFETEDDAHARARTLIKQYPDHNIWVEEVPF